MIAIIDYGSGNLRSIANAFRRIGADARVTSDPQILAAADALVLPGVGAFGSAMAKLEDLRETLPGDMPRASGTSFREPGISRCPGP